MLAVCGQFLGQCRGFLRNLSCRKIGKPLLVGDDLPHYAAAILKAFHTVETMERAGQLGSSKGPKRAIDEVRCGTQDPEGWNGQKG